MQEESLPAANAKNVLVGSIAQFMALLLQLLRVTRQEPVIDCNVSFTAFKASSLNNSEVVLYNDYIIRPLFFMRAHPALNKLSSTLSNKGNLYWLVFICMVMLTLASQLLTHHFIREKMYDEHIVNLAGRQRMLSQKIVKTAYRAIMYSSEHQLSELKRMTNLWNKVHYGLQRGSAAMDLPPLNVEAARHLFERIQPHQTALYRAVEYTHNLDDLSTRIRMIDKQGQKFLVIMDQIVNAFETDAHQKLNRLKHLEIVLAIFFLIILIFEIFFVFLPIYQKITLQNDQLREIAFIQSHEVRRPVCSILGLVQLMEEENDPHALAQYVALLKASTEELEEVTCQIVDQANDTPIAVNEEAFVMR